MILKVLLQFINLFLFPSLIVMYLRFLLEALNQVKSLYFTGDDVVGYEPFCGMLSIADGSINKIGQLLAASICHDGPGPGFLVPWVFRYITRGITAVLPSLPKELLPASAISELYNEVCKPIVSLNLDKCI